jgi:hypothetical protein
MYGASHFCMLGSLPETFVSYAWHSDTVSARLSDGLVGPGGMGSVYLPGKARSNF